MRAANADTDSSFFAYGGPSTTVPLVEIVRLKVPSIERYGILAVGMSRTVHRTDFGLQWELEGTLAKHLERPSLVSYGLAIGTRFVRMPWDRIFQGSFYFGNGLSWANGDPEVEIQAIGRTNRLLYHIILEYEFRPRTTSLWSFFFRDHHRSGVFGLFNGISGGSDFLCLGVRKMF